MRKVTVILLALLMVVSLAACARKSEPAETSPSDGENSAAQTDETEEAESAADGSRILVAYFSATNTTEGVAQYAADILNADLYEIVPEVAYTDADLNYNDDSSRSTVEMNDPSSRPAISGAVENMEQYEIVFIGYPIWWGQAPRIVSTFMESYDFSGKTVVPFCTSGSSGIGSSAAGLQQLTDNARWLEGQRFSGGSTREEIAAWIESLNLDA